MKFSYQKEHGIKSVSFDISRYGKHIHTLKFTSRVSIEQAIEKAENFLNKPLTKTYYEKVKDDLFEDPMSFQDVVKTYPTRGSLLGDSQRIESLQIEKGDHLYLVTGS